MLKSNVSDIIKDSRVKKNHYYLQACTAQRLVNKIYKKKYVKTALQQPFQLQKTTATLLRQSAQLTEQGKILSCHFGKSYMCQFVLFTCGNRTQLTNLAL